MKKTILFIVGLLVCSALVLSITVFIWWTEELKAPSTSAQTHTVLVIKGSSAEQIATKLFEAKVIKSVFVFRAYVKFTHKAANLPVGEFEIPGNLSVPQVIAFLQKGPQEVWVTLPEGLRREQISSKIGAAVGFTDTQTKAFASSFLTLTKDDEGYLFPETYLVPKDVTPEKAISFLKNTFEKKFPNSTKEQVILASLLERETRTDSEKPIIAGILQNRIALGMPLQVDASVQYAKANATCAPNCTEWWPTVYLDDYKLKSAYNTYEFSGLPPAPIANPGLSSLEAAANPSKNDYLYYIHDKNGVVHFAKTYDEHLANVQKYLR